MRRSIALLLVLATLCLAGCGSDSREVVATVGNHAVLLGHVSDFDKYFPIPHESAEAEFEAKKRHVDSLINIRLLLMGAYQNDLDIDREVLQIMQSQEPKFLLDELFKHEILDKIRITDAEAKDFYDKLKEEIHIKHIIVDSERLADSLYNAATGGAEFEQLARDFSLDQSTSMRGGDLGYVRWGMLYDQFQEVAFKLSPGQISHPFNTDAGWHIAMVVDKRETDPGPYRELENMLKAQIQDKKRQTVMNEYLDNLASKVDIKLDEGAHGALIDLVNKVYPDTLGGKAFRKTFIDLELLPDYQKSQILALYDGGEMTVEEYLNAVSGWPPAQRPELDDVQGVKDAVFGMRMDRFLRNEALASGLDKTEGYKTVLDNFKEDVMADRMRQLVIQAVSEPTEEDIYTYYNEHPEEFEIPKRIRLTEIQLDDGEFAKTVREQIDSGADFDSLAGEHTVRPGMSSRQGSLGLFRAFEYPELFSAAETMKVDQIRGPIQTADGKWSIIRLDAMEPPVTRKIEDAANDIRSRLIFMQQQEALDQWLDAKRAETTIEVDYDLIWKTIDKGEYE